MDINDQMLSKFKCFLNDICKVFPEHSDSIQQNYNIILELDSLVIEENEIIYEFLERISNISDNIINKDDEIFTDNLFLIKDISMKTLWTSDISKKTKDSIWGYLNVFSLINLNITSGKMMENTQNKLESGEKITKKELKVMKDLKKLNENINTNNASSSDDTFESLENTSLGNLAKEITKDLNIDDSNAQDMLNPNNMMNIFQTINSTLQQKVDNNELDMNSLFSEASGFMNNSGLMGNMMGMMGAGNGSDGEGEGMPDIGNMMNMMSQMMQQPPPQQGNQRQSQPSQSNQNINPTQQRLRKKLDEKNNN
jgi:hypothetical protein